MIQLNLLPDVKLEYLRAQHTRRLAISISVIAAIASLVLLVLLLAVDGVQYKHLKDLSGDINKESAQLQAQPQIGKILTVQNQLESLTALHNKKPAVSRLFTYLNEVTPANVSINSFSTDFTQNTATITGSTNSLASVNKYVDTLKFTTFSGSGSKSSPAFSNVVLSSFGVSSGQSGKGATYSINLAYDPTLFDITQNPNLTVPNEVSTRSQVDSPSDLFQPTGTTSTQAGGGQ